MARPEELDEDEVVDQEAPADEADPASDVIDTTSPQQEQTAEAIDLDASNDKRAAEEVAQADSLKEAQDSDSGDSDSTVEASKDGDDSKASDLIDADDDKAVAPDKEEEEAQKATDSGVSPEMLAAYNAVKDDKDMSPLQKKQVMMETYQKLLDEQKKGLAQAALMQGADKVAQGMAMKYGGNPGDNVEGVKTMQDMSNLPVNQYLQNQLNQYRVQRANLADAQSGLANEKVKQLQAGNVPVSPAIVSYLKQDWMQKHPQGDPKNMPDFASMTPNQLKQMSIGKPMGTSLLNTQPVRGLMNKETGNPVIMDKMTQQLEDAVTHEPIKSGNVIRGIPTKDAFGNLIYAGVPGSSSIKVNNAKTATTPIDTAAQGETPQAKLTLFQLRDQNPAAAKAIEHEQAAMYGKDSLLKKLRDAGYREDLFNAKLIPTNKNPDGTLTVDSGMAPAIRAQMAALAVGGVPGEHAMSEFGGAGGLKNKVDRLISGTVSGKVTQADLDFYNKYSHIMHNTIQNSVQKAAQIHIDNVMSQFPMNRDQAADLLGVSDIIPAGQAAQDIISSGGKRYLVDHSTKKVIKELPSGQ